MVNDNEETRDPLGHSDTATKNPTKRAERPAPLPNALAFRVDEVARLGGPGRTRVYELAAAGKLKLVRVGGRTLVHGDSLRLLLSDGCE